MRFKIHLRPEIRNYQHKSSSEKDRTEKFFNSIDWQFFELNYYKKHFPVRYFLLLTILTRGRLVWFCEEL